METQIIGPPGTGKTTELLRHAKQWVARNDARSLMAFSLTRAAADTIRQRCAKQGVLLDRQVSTLHSFTVRQALASGFNLFDEDWVETWNEKVAHGRPELQLPPDVLSPARLQALLEDMEEGAEHERRLTGGERYSLLQTFRSLERDPKTWPSDVQEFSQLYEEFKRKRHLVDFRDTVELVDKAQAPPPRGVRLMLVDESQDHDRTEMRILRRWLPRLQRLTFFGDPLQAIFSFRGAAPELLMQEPVPRKTLPVSYRLPEEIWKYSQQWISQHQPFTPLPTRPRGPGGLVEQHEASLAYSPSSSGHKACLRLLEFLNEQVQQGRTAMVLAATNKHVGYLIHRMKRLGLSYDHPRMDSYMRPKRAVLFSTIHGAKGMEADYVAVFPELAGDAVEHYSWRKQPYEKLRGQRRPWEPDEHPAMPVLRMFYVAITRAREELYLCSPENPDNHNAVVWG